jgi:hypothetical protein
MSKRKKQYRDNHYWMGGTVSNKQRKQLLEELEEIKKEHVEEQPVQTHKVTRNYEFKVGLDITPIKLIAFIFLLFLIYSLVN